MGLIRSSGTGPLGDLREVDVEIRSRKEVNDRFAPILGMYERFLDVEPKDIDEYVKGISVQVTPPEINQFMHMTRTYENHPQYNGYTGRFISVLMQRAINDRHLDFTLDMNGLQPLHDVGHRIVGTLENKVNITINGEVGNWCLLYARNVGTVNIEQAGDYCLYVAQNVETVKIGNAGNWCLHGANAVGHVYTPNHDLAQRIKKEDITWKKGCKIHLISQEDFDARMRR